MPNERKKVVFFVNRKFWPITSGHETMLYNICKGLKYKQNCAVHILCFVRNDNEKTYDDLPDFIEEVRYVDKPSKLSVLSTLLKKSIISTSWPMQVALYYSKYVGEEFRRFVNDVKPSSVFIDMIRLVPYIDTINNFKGKRFFYAEDDLSKRYERLIKASSSGNMLGYLSDGKTNIINGIASNKFVKSILFKMEIKRINRYEKSFIDKFDNVIYVSPIETREFNKKFNTNKAVTFTMGADVIYYNNGVADSHVEGSLVFVGNFMIAPNAASIEYIAKEIMPKLDKRIVLYAIGKYPDELKDRVGSDRVKFLGFVDDIRATVKSMDLYVSPITYGTGIKTKVVEAMAMGMPVITNSVGAEGLEVKNGKELVIADTTEEIINQINLLLYDKEKCNQLSRAGHEYVMKNHDWDEVYKVFDEIKI